MTDTKTLLTEPITNAGGPILSLTKDPSRGMLWVSTPSSSLCAWPLPSGSPTQPVHAIDLEAHPDPAPTDPPHMPSPRAMPLRALSLPRERLPTAARVEPRVTLAGTPPLVRCAAFGDRRHVLTKDAAGCIALWDLVQGKPVKQYPNGKVQHRAVLQHAIQSREGSYPAALQRCNTLRPFRKRCAGSRPSVQFPL